MRSCVAHIDFEIIRMLLWKQTDFKNPTLTVFGKCKGLKREMNKPQAEANANLCLYSRGCSSNTLFSAGILDCRLIGHRRRKFSTLQQ